MGILGGSTNQKSGKCHELENKYRCKTNVDPSHPGGSGGGGVGVKISTKVREISRTAEKIDFRGQKIKSPGNVMNCRENY